MSSQAKSIPDMSKQAPLTKTAAEVPGPVPGTRMTEEYVRMVGRDAYFWGWPMVNLYNRRLTYAKVPTIGIAGPAPAAPLNQLGMLTDYIVPEERVVACPNQDVVYGIGALALDKSPVVIQVPDFGGRFWVYQIVDLRRPTASPNLARCTAAKPGFYLLVGPDWKGAVPNGINTSVPRHNQHRHRDPARVPRRHGRRQAGRTGPGQPDHDVSACRLRWQDEEQRLDQAAKSFLRISQGDAEIRWVKPETFFDVLPAVMNDAHRCRAKRPATLKFGPCSTARRKDPKLKEALNQVAVETDSDLVTPLFQFRNYGLPLQNQWTTQKNGADFGTDYFTRTAVAKSNIFVNKPDGDDLLLSGPRRQRSYG